MGNDFGDNSFGTATIGYLIIYIGRNLKNAGTIGLRLLRAEYLRTPEECVNLIAAIDATLYLSPTLHNEESALATLLRLLLQFQQQLYFRILGT